MDTHNIALLNKVLKNKFNDISLECLLESSFKNNLFQTSKNKIIIHQNDPASHIYILLEGKVAIMDEYMKNSDGVIDYIYPVHILGLVELLNQIPTYSAFVMTVSPCTFLKIKTSDFMKGIQIDPTLCYHTLLSLSHVTLSNMYRAKSKYLLQQENILGHYLFQQSEKFGIPYVYPYTRERLSDELHINLRTLYRYLNTLKNDELLTLKHGKIIISNKNFKKLYDRYADLSFK